MKKVMSLGVAALLLAAVGTNPALAKKGPEFHKVTNYLFEATYDNHEQYQKEAQTFFNKYNVKLGGCSSVQNGALRGRNYDWTFDEEPEFVIHVPANKAGRHASVGVAATTAFTAADVEKGTANKKVVNLLPYITLDGINDAGLTINTNVVTYGEKGEFVMKTKDTSDDVCPLMVPRLLLDNCGSIDEALAMMEKMDIFSLGAAEEAHYMISGPQSKTDKTFNTVVVELIPDENKHYQLSVIDYNKGQFVDNKPIMTNFHLTDFDGSLASTTQHPMGWERYQILSENFDQGKTVRGMADLMKKVYFTRAYDLHGDRFWYSEFFRDDLDKNDFGTKQLNGDISKAGKFAPGFQEAMNDYSTLKRDAKTWHTVHTSIYDTANKVLYIQPQEGSLVFEFPLNKK